MSEPKIERIERVTPTSHDWAGTVLASGLAHALVASLAATFAIFPLAWAFGLGLARATQVVALLIGVFFGAVALTHIFHLTRGVLERVRANLQAWAEIVLDRDLNKSGRTGDVVYKVANEEGPEQRLVFFEHLREFYKQIPIRGTERNRWLTHKAQNGTMMPAYQFDDGLSITRQEYDAILHTLQELGVIKGRGKGKTGARAASLPSALGAGRIISEEGEE